MGMINLLNTMMNTAFDLLINTVLYIMGIAVLAGALGAMLTEFGVVALINKLLSPLMGVLYMAAWRCLRWNRHNLPV